MVGMNWDVTRELRSLGPCQSVETGTLQVS